ncbi:hypothetical protein EGW08_015827 [Elysia chlorotica]|uniref:Uncharacterized protein n=1 Tax=Elysia chlorotica TaxID=188477 RepID=A0A3S1AZV4_ELYCH|nr:hypothetical protein EGW08_015827 [Elysia chlorotica]
MATQPKPLRFLFSKYAALAPNRASPEAQGILRPLKLPSWGKSGSLSDLHLLGSDVSQSKLDRINLFLALSEIPGRSPPSLVDSTAGTNTSQDTTSCGQSRGRPRGPDGGGRGSLSGSPTSRFRSKSQEFENIYRLAAARCSPEFLKNGRVHVGSSTHKLIHTNHSPPGNNGIRKHEQISKPYKNQKHIKLSLNPKRPESETSNDLSIRDEENALPTLGVMHVMIEERRNTGTDGGRGSLRPAHPLSYSYQDLNAIIGGGYPARQRRQRGFSAKRVNCHGEGSRDEASPGDREQRIPAGQLPRCPSLSTVDADRLDSSCYHYLLEGLSSSSASSTLSSDHSDDGQFSKVSARAQRPSTSGTEATALRIRNLHTRTTDLSSPPAQSQVGCVLPLGMQAVAPSSGVRSPELPWPPRYALSLPWVTHEDIQANNAPDFGVCGRQARRLRDRNRDRNRGVGQTWDKDFGVSGLYSRRKVHVVPSHVSTDSEQLNACDSQYAKYKARNETFPEVTSTPSHNDTQTSNKNHFNTCNNNGFNKHLFSNHHNQRKGERTNGHPPSPEQYLPPPTATTTNSSLKVNIGVKDPSSASPARARIVAAAAAIPREERAPSNTRPITRGTLLVGKPDKPPLCTAASNGSNQTSFRHISSRDHRASRQDPSGFSDQVNQPNQPRKTRSSVSYSWDRASKVSLVNTTV